MTRLRRPYIPLSVRVEVAERQLREMMNETHPRGRDASTYWMFYANSMPYMALRKRLDYLLKYLFGDQPYQLDHDPALSLRRVRFGNYVPDANSPDHLVYRAKDGHLQKTTGRRPGAERTVTSKGSDVWLKKKFDRLEGRTKRRPKQKIPSRGFQKGKRKINAKRTTRK